MVFKVIAIESFEPMDLVSLLFNDSNRVACRKTLPSEPPDAISRRRIADGEFIMFDSAQNTDDLLRPRAQDYEAFLPTWLVSNKVRPR
jgi:hypothetical protein